MIILRVYDDLLKASLVEEKKEYFICFFAQCDKMLIILLLWILNEEGSPNFHHCWISFHASFEASQTFILNLLYCFYVFLLSSFLYFSIEFTLSRELLMYPKGMMSKLCENFLISISFSIPSFTVKKFVRFKRDFYSFHLFSHLVEITIKQEGKTLEITLEKEKKADEMIVNSWVYHSKSFQLSFSPSLPSVVWGNENRWFFHP